MNNFTFYSPTYFVFGKEEENNTGKYVKRFGGNKVLIHYGGGSVVRSGLLDRVKKSLELGYKTVMWSFAYFDWDEKKQPSQDKAKKMIINNL